MHHDAITTILTQFTSAKYRVKSFNLSISSRYTRRRLWSDLAFHRLYDTRSFLKNVFWPNLCVGRLFQALKIPAYSSGLNLASALILNQNPILETASIESGDAKKGECVMKLALFKHAVLILAFLLLTASASYAKASGYFFIVAYSIFQKTAYHTSIFTQEVEGTSYSEDEYVTDVPLMLRMESQFGAYLKTKTHNVADFTVSVRGAYKTIQKASQALKGEKSEWLGKEYTINQASDFRLSGD